MTFNLFDKKPQSPLWITGQRDSQRKSFVIDDNPVHLFYIDLQEEDGKMHPVLKGFLEKQEKEFDDLFDLSI